jgi:hypothetical protein
MPVPLLPLPVDIVTDAQPTATPVPPTPTVIWPPPLTPVITTPTAVAPPATFAPVPGTGLSPLAPTPSPTEVALARAGGDLLAGLAPAEAPTTPQPFPTPRPTLMRTPRPNLTPILPQARTPAPTPTPDPGLLDRILRDLLDLVR